MQPHRSNQTRLWAFVDAHSQKAETKQYVCLCSCHSFLHSVTDRCEIEDCILEVCVRVVIVDDFADFVFEFVHGGLLSGWCFVRFDFPDDLVADVGGVFVRPAHVLRIESWARALVTASRLTRFARSANLIAFGDRRIFAGQQFADFAFYGLPRLLDASADRSSLLVPCRYRVRSRLQSI